MFYAWQSDSGPQQRNAIRHALDDAACQIEAKGEWGGPSIAIDDATRGLPGSPNISASIREKIVEADVFVADATLVSGLGEGSTQKRSSPNPNVMFELGFAVAELGWDRIVLLFNKDLPMKAEDLPFDVRGHRASPFSMNEKGALMSLLIEAIGTVLLKQPPRPGDLAKLSPDQVKRDRDLRRLRAALSCIDFTAMDRMLGQAPDILAQADFHHFYGLDGVVSAATFKLYDQTAQRLLESIREDWEGLLSFGVHYTDLTSGDYKFKSGIGWPLTGSVESDYQAMRSHVAKLRSALAELVEYIHAHYLEIDLEEMSALAAKEREEFWNRDR